MHKRNSHCSFCGAPFADDQPWPRVCGNCHNITFRNPIPVAVVLVPVESGLLMIRRGIEPRKGMLALPGGYVNFGESWQQAAAREVFEETGLTLDPAEISLFDVISAPDSTVLIFGQATPRTTAELPNFVPTDETMEMVVLEVLEELAFPLHTQVAEAYFARATK